MKKVLSLLTATALVFAMSATALAADPTTTDSKEEVVTATYTPGGYTEPGTTWSIDITWNNTAAVYTEAGGSYTWDAENLKYKQATDDEAENTDATIAVTVTNRSNAGLTASVAYVDADDDAETTASWTGDTSVQIGTAAIREGVEIDYTDTTTIGTVQEAEFKATVTVDDVKNLDSGTNTLGTVTVTLEA